MPRDIEDKIENCINDYKREKRKDPNGIIIEDALLIDLATEGGNVIFSKSPLDVHPRDRIIIQNKILQRYYSQEAEDCSKQDYEPGKESITLGRTNIFGKIISLKTYSIGLPISKTF